MKTQRTTYLLMLIIATLSVMSCSQEPAEIHYNSDECAHCKMMISDNKFAAQMVTEKGKAIKFDAVECLAGYVKNRNEEFSDAKFWVSDYSKPGQWILAEQAVFIKSDVVKSPMGASLLALPGIQQAEQHLDEKPGETITWEHILEMDMSMQNASHNMQHNRGQ